MLNRLSAAEAKRVNRVVRSMARQRNVALGLPGWQDRNGFMAQPATSLDSRCNGIAPP